MMETENIEDGQYLTSSQAARVLHVAGKTVSRWRKEGRMALEGIRMRRTLGGHVRYHADDLAELAHRLSQEEAS